MFKSSLCDYSYACILLSGTIKVAELEAAGGNNNIQTGFKNWASFTDCISEISNTFKNCSKTSRSYDDWMTSF